MNTVLPPIVAEFDTLEQETHYPIWLKTKLEASLKNTPAGIPHDQVMAQMATFIDEEKNKPNAKCTC